MKRNVKNMALNTAKRTLVYSKSAEIRCLTLFQNMLRVRLVTQLKVFRPLAEVLKWGYK